MFSPPQQYWGGQAPSGYDAPGAGGGEARLSNVEAALREVAGCLEAHIADTAKQMAALRLDVQQATSRGSSGSNSAGNGFGFGAGFLSRAPQQQDQSEAYELRARLARLEAEVHRFGQARGGGGGGGGGSGGFFGYGPGAAYAMAAEAAAAEGSGWDSEDSDLVLVGGKQAAGGASGGGFFDGWLGGGQTEAQPAPLPEVPHHQSQSWQELPADAVVVLEDSIWDCALVIILHQGCQACKDPRQQWYLGFFNIIHTWVLLSINVIVQVLFIVAVHSMSNPYPWAELGETMLDTRLMLGQLYTEMDRRSMTTRAERTCNNQVYDSMARTVQDVAEYLSLAADKGLLVLSGSMICFLAMLFWVVEMTVELRRCMDLLLVVYGLPSTKRTVIEESGSAHVVKGVTFYHKFLSLTFVLIPRFLISWYLLMFGKRFLAGTSDITELILNTCALEFVRNVDDMIFEAMASRTLILFTQTARIFRFDALSQQSLLDEKTADDFQLAGKVNPRVARRYIWTTEVFNVFCAIAFITIQSYEGYHVLIQPFAAGAQSVYANVCERQTRFTYLMHPVTEVPVFAQADRDTEAMINVRCFYVAQYEMVRMRAGFDPVNFPPNDTLSSLLNGTSPKCQAKFGQQAEIPCPEMELASLSSMRNMGEDGYYASPSCRDQDVAFSVLRSTCLSPNFYRGVSLHELGFFQEAHRCSDLINNCRGTRTGNFTFRWYQKLRRLCADTCGLCTSSEVVAS